MDKAEALELIRQKRSAGSLSGTDMAIAQRAARSYLGGGICIICPVVLEICNFAASGKLPIWRVAISLGLLVLALFFFWKSWQFTQARQLVETVTEQRDGQDCAPQKPG